MAVKKVKKVTIEEVETPKEATPEIVEKEEVKSEPIEEWTYDKLVLLSKEEFQKVEALVREWKAKFVSQ